MLKYRVCVEGNLDLLDKKSWRFALGARLVGGGFGGSAIALIEDEDAGKISLAIEKAFADAGYRAPRFFDSLPSDGAKVIS